MIRLFLSDVDGCMTDGGMWYTEDGLEVKRFCVYDGMGMVRLQKAGIPCGILTSEVTPIVEKRAKKLNLKYLYMGVGSQVREGVLTKLQACEKICQELSIGLEDVAFVGDDINDIDLLQAVGHPFCPQTARPEVLAIPNIHVVPVDGGQGVIREIADEILKAQK